MFTHLDSPWSTASSTPDPESQERLANIQAEIVALLQARDQLLERLAQLNRELFVRKEESMAVRNRSADLLERLRAGGTAPGGRELTPEETEQFADVGGLGNKLQTDVEKIERHVRIASFEVSSLQNSLESLRDEIIRMAEKNSGPGASPPSSGAN